MLKLLVQAACPAQSQLCPFRSIVQIGSVQQQALQHQAAFRRPQLVFAHPLELLGRSNQLEMVEVVGF